MMHFFADNHYDSFPGRHVYDGLAKDFEIAFHENEWATLEEGAWEKGCELLILSMVGGTCGQPLPGPGAEAAVKRYCERGGNLLLLHASSAAFWQWNWWRGLVGLRWVRGEDPDGIPPSTHPRHAYKVIPSKSRHPIASRLKTMEFPDDEIFTDLEYTCPVFPLMETHIEEGIFVQVHEACTPWGGKLIGFLPGHYPVATDDPVLHANVKILIEYLKAT